MKIRVRVVHVFSLQPIAYYILLMVEFYIIVVVKHGRRSK